MARERVGGREEANGGIGGVSGKDSPEGVQGAEKKMGEVGWEIGEAGCDCGGCGVGGRNGPSSALAGDSGREPGIVGKGDAFGRECACTVSRRGGGTAEVSQESKQESSFLDATLGAVLLALDEGMRLGAV